MNRRHCAVDRSDPYRKIGVALALAVLLAQSASAVLPTYGPREVLFFTGAPGPQETASVDFNCDGRVDVFLLQAAFQQPATYPVRIFLSDGQGSFTDGTTQVITGTVPRVQWPRKTLVEDFNADGRPDVFVADTGMDRAPFPGYQSTLLLSTTGCQMIDGTSGLPQQLADTHSAAAADVDGDGDVDLFMGNYFGGQQPQIQPQILVNDGTGRFSILAGALPTAQATLSQNSYTTAAFADVDGDGDADLVLGGDNFTQSAVVLNDGFGHFTLLPNAMPAKPFAPTANILDIKSLDLNSDGKEDLVLAATKNDPYYQGRWIQALINNGNGTFRDETTLRMPQTDNINTWFIFIELVDVDGDGLLDVVGKVPYQTNINGGGDHVFWINNGAGVFTRATLFTPFNGLDGVFAFVDLEADGHRDLLSIGDVQTSRRRQTGTAIAPGIPQGVRVTGMTDRVRVSWMYTWGATEYQVWRSADPGSPGTQIGTTSAVSLDDLTASGTPMFYSVRAVNGTATSASSARVPGAVAVPTAPAFVTQPSPQAALIGGELQFKAAARGVPAPTYQWQLSVDLGNSWTNVPNAAPYSGATAPTLLVTNAPLALNGVRYRCLATNSSGTAVSSVASAILTTNLPFTDHTLTPRSTMIRAVHVIELRARIDAVRARYKLPAYAYATPAIVAGATPIKATDIVEMQTALSHAYVAAGLSAPAYGATPSSGAVIVTAPIQQLRAALVVIEPPVVSLFDFIGGFASAARGVRFGGVDTPLGNGATINQSSIVAGGVSRTGFFIHPPYLGQIGGETFLEYSVPVPPQAFLQFSVGVADNATCTDGVTFRVTAGATTELWSEHVTRTGFHDIILRLDAYGGTTVPLRFVSHPGPANNPNCDWSLWTQIMLGSVPSGG